MLKKIPKSDIQIRPFKAYKEWSFNQSSREIQFMHAEDGLPYDTTELAADYDTDLYTFRKNELYGQLRAQFYNGEEDNPLLRFGSKTSFYNKDSTFKNERFLSGSAKVISIPQRYTGEGIKKGSVSIYDSGANKTYVDDGYGNMVINNSTTIQVGNLDFETGVFTFTFTDFYNNTTEYTASVDSNTWNVETGEIEITYDGNTYLSTLISYDSNTGIMIVDRLELLGGLTAETYVGNVFYSQGIITFTKYTNLLFNSDWNLSYKSTVTIYENEYLIVVNEDEFNVSTNPTAVVFSGVEMEDFTDSNGVTHKILTNPGVKYIRKSQVTNDGQLLDFRYTGSISSSVTHDWVYAGFEHWDVSGSTDPTGSFLAPYITTIGLYDNNADLLVVAKLPKPIKSLHDYPINFLIRFDT